VLAIITVMAAPPPEPPETLSQATAGSRLTHPALMWIVVGVAFVVVGRFSDRLTIGVSAAPHLIGAGIVIAAAALFVAWRRPPRRTMVAWLLPRVALALVAGSVLMAVASPDPSSQPAPALICPTESDHEDYRGLIHTRLRGDTLVCVYEYVGGAIWG
jgi:hypothetical protein